MKECDSCFQHACLNDGIPGMELQAQGEGFFFFPWQEIFLERLIICSTPDLCTTIGVKLHCRFSSVCKNDMVRKHSGGLASVPPTHPLPHPLLLPSHQQRKGCGQILICISTNRSSGLFTSQTSQTQEALNRRANWHPNAHAAGACARERRAYTCTTTVDKGTVYLLGLLWPI